MRLLPYLFRNARREILLVAGLGLLGGISSAALIAVINRVLHSPSAASLLLAAFVIATLVKIGSGLASSLLLLQMTQGCILKLCDEMCRRILETPFRRLEEVGAARILACLTDDVNALSAAIQAVPPLTVNMAILAGCWVYLVWLSWTAALAMLAMVAIGAICYKLLMTRGHRAFQLAREGRDSLYRHFRSLTEGMKELKLSRERRDAFLTEDIGGAVEYLREKNIIAVRRYMAADAWSQLMFYLLLAALLFALPAVTTITTEALTAYVFTALFTATPVWGIVAALPSFSRGQAALERLEGLGLSLEPPKPPSCGGAAETYREPPRLQFDRVEFAYGENGNGGGFKMGPLDLELKPGELVFVIGGNGSGKSTFVKVLTGLYVPQSGEIRIDGKRVTDESRESYRHLFSVVYSDFFLFDRLLGMKAENLQVKAGEYLDALRLANKVSLKGDTLSTTALSQGQRRRLALLMAYLEDRPIYVLDEWAADQDPTFRQVFYTRLLPELKRRGKTVVVVTHDDRYFHLGDRIIKLDYGTAVDPRESFAGRGDSAVEAAACAGPAGMRGEV